MPSRRSRTRLRMWLPSPTSACASTPITATADRWRATRAATSPWRTIRHCRSWPALAYLDVIAEVSRLSNLPVAAYNVSGEYAMLKAAGQKGWIDERRALLEILTGIKRAGADLILTYSAVDAARSLSDLA